MTQKTDASGGDARQGQCGGTIRALACLGTVTAVALAGGCGGSSGGIAQPLPSRTPSATSSASPTADPSANDAALAQYRAFWSVLTSASTANAAQRPAMLQPYAANPELDSLMEAMRNADRQGTVFYGHDLPRPTVQSLSATQGIAVISDCQDSSHAGNKNRRTGQLLTVGVVRHLVFATMNLGPDGKWRVVSVSYEKTPC